MLLKSKICLIIILSLFNLIPFVSSVANFEDGDLEDLFRKLNPIVPSKKNPPLPKRMGNVLDLKEPDAPGSWYLGETPPNFDPKKPPILFVQGMHQSPSSWWDKTTFYEDNDMYLTAYDRGYRTIFIRTYDKPKSGLDQWENGKVLSKILEKVSEYFGQKLNVVGFSKGGVDLQTAIVHYGAYPYVNKVVTLASPHHGSHLADLAHSWYAKWAFDLFNRADQSSYVLQTGLMSKFREQMDANPNSKKNKYYTAGGTSIGPLPLAFGGLYLTKYGPNDGLVNLWSTQLPYSKLLFALDYDHDQMQTGVTFDAIDKVFSSEEEDNLRSGYEKPSYSNENYLHAGKLAPKKVVEHKVNIEEMNKVSFNFITKRADSEVHLISPSGKVFDKKDKSYLAGKAGEYFAGLFLQSYTIVKPEKGTWTLKISNKYEDAFFLSASFEGAQTLVDETPPTARGSSLPLKVKLINSSINSQSISTKTKLVTPKGEMLELSNGKRLSLFTKSIGTLDIAIPSKLEKGLYNVTIEVDGKYKSGLDFKRTIVRSIYLDK